MKSILHTAILTALLGVSLSACDSDSGSSSQITLSGTAMAGPVDGTLSVYDEEGAVVAETSVVEGAFQLKLAKNLISTPLSFQATGQYTDEVSGEQVQLRAGYPLALYAEAGELGNKDHVALTPDSTVLHQLIHQQGLDPEQARLRFKNTFGYQPDINAGPYDPTAQAPEGADPQRLRSTLQVGTYSQWADELGLSGDERTQLPSALAEDLSDENLDGLNSQGAAVMIGARNLQQLHEEDPLLARYLMSMAHYAGSDTNHNGANVSAPTDGLPSNGINDSLPASRRLTLADGSEVQVQLTIQNEAPFSDMPATARTRHRLTLTYTATGEPVDMSAEGSPVTALEPMLMMHMLSGHNHTTPYVSTYADSSDPANGHYDYDVYYVMASNMSMDDMQVPMGLWEMRLSVQEQNGDSQDAIFHPEVQMAMGDTLLSAKGADTDDRVMGMDQMEMPRPYWLWMHSIQAQVDGSHDLIVFLSSKDGMSFPAVHTGTGGVMGDSMMEGDMSGSSLSVSSVSVEVSTDNGNNWTAMNDNGEGYYSLQAISGLSTTAINSLSFRIQVNGHAITDTAGAELQLSFQAPSI